jgi:GH24 family phage-related lysozyme (muramidase)
MLNHKLIAKIDNKPFEELSKDEQQKALNNKFFELIKRGEGFVGKPYFDIASHPTIGHGINLNFHSDKVFYEMNITDKTHQKEYLKIMQDENRIEKRKEALIELKNRSNETLLDKLNNKYKEFNQSINLSVNQTNTSVSSNSTNNTTISSLEFFTTPSVDIKKKNIEAEFKKMNITNKEQIKEYKEIWGKEIDEFKKKERAIIKKYDEQLQSALTEKYAEFNPNLADNDKVFKISKEQSRNIFNKLTEEFQSSLDKALHIGKKNEIFPKNSKEYAALLDLTYNTGAKILQQSKLIAALNSDSRAEAWYEIRYASNEGVSKSFGIANRRAVESSEFGLYENSKDSMLLEEAKNIIGMYILHKEEIAEEEKEFDEVYKNGKSIKEQLEPVLKYFKERVKKDTDKDIQLTLDDIILGLDGTSNDELIFANGITKAGEGSDIIYSGSRANILMGGAGDDTYVYNKDNTSTVTISDNGALKDKNRLVLKGFNLEDAKFVKDDDKNQLIISFRDREGSITIADYQCRGKIESFKFDDKEIVRKDIDNLIIEDKIKSMSLADLILDNLNRHNETPMTMQEFVTKAMFSEEREELKCKNKTEERSTEENIVTFTHER